MDEAPPTSMGELEQGIFNLIISLVGLYRLNGMSILEAAVRVAALLDNLSEAVMKTAKETLIEKEESEC